MLHLCGNPSDFKHFVPLESKQPAKKVVGQTVRMGQQDYGRMQMSEARRNFSARSGELSRDAAASGLEQTSSSLPPRLSESFSVRKWGRSLATMVGCCSASVRTLLSATD